MLGDGPEIGAGATISLRRDGKLVPMDRGGHPTINPFINPDGEKNLYKHPAASRRRCELPGSVVQDPAKAATHPRRPGRQP